MHASIRDIRSTARSKIPRASCGVLDDNDELSQTFVEERMAFRQHFKHVMEGKVLPLSDVVDLDRSDDSFRYDGVGALDIQECWRSIPSPTAVINMNLHANMFKAPGENIVVGNAHRIFAKEIGTLMYPLVVKTFVRVQPPIAWRGGMVHEIYKNKGPRHLRSSFRDVLLANDSGKLVSKHLRRNLVPRAKLLVHASQFGGGFNGGETAFTNLSIRCAADLCKSQGLSFSALYVDVVSAFASMLRRAAFDVNEGDEVWISHLKAFGFDQVDIVAIRDTVAHLASWSIDSGGGIVASSDGGTNLCVNVARQWYRGTWVSQEGIPNVIQTDIGCMAGTPLADLLFTVVMSRILYVARMSITSDGLESCVQIGSESVVLCDASFVDDCVEPICDCALKLTHKATQIASVLVRTFACFQLSLNFNAGKSECTAVFAGHGKKAAMRALSRANNVTSFPDVDGSSRELRWVRSYKHVGTFSSIGNEVSVRCSAMKSSFASLRKSVFRNPKISLERHSLRVRFTS